MINAISALPYLRAMYDRFGNVTAMLAAYNAGPGRYEDHALRGRPLPAETVAYLARLLPLIGTSETTPTIVAPPSWRNAVLFAARAGDKATSLPPVDPAPAARPPSGLFIRTSTQVSR